MAPRDVAFARELTFGVQRRRKILDFILEPLLERGWPRPEDARFALRLGAYQILFLTRVPQRAAVDTSVPLAGRLRGLVNAILRRLCRSVSEETAVASETVLPLPGDRNLTLEGPLPELGSPAALSILYGVPEFLIERWLQRHGAETAEQLAKAASVTPVVHLRAVRAISAEDLADKLAVDGVVTEPACHPRMLTWTDGSSPFATQAYRDGLFVVQDPTALEAALAVKAAPGEQILDLCAAPGTKSTELADAVGPDGVVFAYDIDPHRRGMIEDNAKRLNLESLCIVNSLDEVGKVDAVLVDVPCSNSGVLARRVEVRDRITEAGIEKMFQTQVSILHQALDFLKPGGRIIYSTCSIEPEENGGVVAAVSGTKGLVIKEQRLTLPDPPKHDGGYYAVLYRKDP